MAYDAGPPRREPPPQPKVGRVRVTPWFSWLLLVCTFVCCMQLKRAYDEERAYRVILEDVVRHQPRCVPRAVRPTPQRSYRPSDAEVDA